MAEQNFRTYRRRTVTRESGFHTCDETTGGECYLINSTKCIIKQKVEKFTFKRDKINLVELFSSKKAIIAFGGYIRPSKKIILKCQISYEYSGKKYSKNKEGILECGVWKNVGIHDEILLQTNKQAQNIQVMLEINGETNTDIEFACFDLDAVTKKEFQNSDFEKTFYQKTEMHVPYLYYLDPSLPFEKYLVKAHTFQKGSIIVCKSCNRCGRFLPINVENEMKTLSFSLHCKKRAPCKHSTFCSYVIQNLKDFTQKELAGLPIKGDKLISYYGHQLECKACKKFFVNAPLNPQRNAQQFKEDGLRRRALEILVNKLLDRNLVHFEFERKTKKEFSEYIWKKFGKKCFKCGPSSKEISLDDMALDHTMPLAYLYRLDETATCLCSSHNSQKSDHFPVDFYSENELLKLSEITGLDYETLHSKTVNKDVLKLLIENVVWFYDEFLMDPEYQKERDGIKTADKINDSLKRVIGSEFDLVERYKSITGHYPESVTIK